MYPENNLAKNSTVLYIVGAGNSGTTLLSRVLGSHPYIRNIGELNHINRYYTQGLMCACGESLSECSYWSKISKDLYDSPVNLDRSLKTKLKLLFSFKKLGTVDGKDNPLQGLNEFYKEIFLSGQEDTLVDSSKDVVRLMYMSIFLPFNIVPIYVVRDGRAYIDSYLQRGGRSVVKGYLRWVSMNLRTLIVVKRVSAGHPFVHIPYNDLVHNPEEVIKDLCDKAGLDFDTKMLDYGEMVSHAIAGTRSKSLGRSIQPHEKWRTRLSKRNLFLFSLLGGNFMNRLLGV